MTDFCSTSYLYLKENNLFQKKITAGIKKYGLNFGGSRLNNMCPRVYEEAELFFSEFLGNEESLITSSGTLAGIILTSWLSENEYNKVYVAADIHPSLLATRMKYEIFDDLSLLCNKIKSSDDQNNRFVIINSINPSTLNFLSGEKLFFFRSFKNLIFIIDDSHGLGITGKDGRGFSTVIKETGLPFVLVSSLAKAFGIRGGLVSGDSNLITSMKNSTLWGGASPPPPFFFSALLSSIEIYRSELNKLKKNIEYFRDMIYDSEMFKYIDDFPVYLLKKEINTQSLANKNIIISSFRYPTKNDPLIQRIVLNSSHTFEQMDKLYKILKEDL